MLEIFILFLVGIGVGTFGTLVGIGGGLIMIPLFTFALTPSIFQTAPQIIGTSLFGVFLNAISGTFAYVNKDAFILRQLCLCTCHVAGGVFRRTCQ